MSERIIDETIGKPNGSTRAKRRRAELNTMDIQTRFRYKKLNHITKTMKRDPTQKNRPILQRDKLLYIYVSGTAYMDQEVAECIKIRVRT